MKSILLFDIIFRSEENEKWEMNMAKQKAMAAVAILSLLSTLSVFSWSGGDVDSHTERAADIAQKSQNLKRIAEVTAQPTTQVVVAADEKRVLTPEASANLFHTGKVMHHTDGLADNSGLLNGVILILYGGRLGGGYFRKYALPRMNEHFLRCFPYPLHIFYEEGVPEEELLSLRQLANYTNVTFELISFAKLPPGVTEDKVDKWKREGTQKKFQGRGYRQMCRFWAGSVWSFPSLQKYKYYMRWDTDSIIPTTVPSDPFKRLENGKCTYGYNRLKNENPHVTVSLWETTLKWMEDSNLSPASQKRIKNTILENGKYMGAMYYNNFELGTLELKNHPSYQSFFRYIDSHEPFGIFRYRWGDAPLHTIGISAAIEDKKQYCNYSRVEFPYQHNPAKKNIAAIPSQVRCKR